MFKKRYEELKRKFICEIGVVSGDVKIANYEVNCGNNLCTMESLKRFQESLLRLNTLESRILDSKLKAEDKLTMIRMITDHRTTLVSIDIGKAERRIKELKKLDIVKAEEQEVKKAELDKIDVPKFNHTATCG